ncbi:hypothetical protein C0995_002908 [Termitomyces sp. Mi166|nr:hypothetical protein C0995_002908 [Termitomyces sp. Mi166\
MMDLAQQHNEIFWDLHLSKAELFQQAQDLFKNLKQPKSEASADDDDDDDDFLYLLRPCPMLGSTGPLKTPHAVYKLE